MAGVRRVGRSQIGSSESSGATSHFQLSSSVLILAIVPILICVQKNSQDNHITVTKTKDWEIPARHEKSQGHLDS